MLQMKRYRCEKVSRKRGIRVIVGFRRDVNEICALLGFAQRRVVVP